MRGGVDGEKIHLSGMMNTNKFTLGVELYPGRLANQTAIQERERNCVCGRKLVIYVFSKEKNNNGEIIVSFSIDDYP